MDVPNGIGIRPKRAFRLAATKYLNESHHKRRIADEALHLKQLDPYIGHLSIESVHAGTLQPFIKARRKHGIKTKSINLALGVVRHILNLAASEWLDENNLTWLQSPPKIKLLPVTDARQPYPLSWEEQDRLFRELPPHLARMALFKVNTGTGRKKSAVCAGSGKCRCASWTPACLSSRPIGSRTGMSAWLFSIAWRGP